MSSLERRYHELRMREEPHLRAGKYRMASRLHRKREAVIYKATMRCEEWVLDLWKKPN